MNLQNPNPKPWIESFETDRRIASVVRSSQVCYRLSLKWKFEQQARLISAGDPPLNCETFSKQTTFEPATDSRNCSRSQNQHGNSVEIQVNRELRKIGFEAKLSPATASLISPIVTDNLTFQTRVLPDRRTGVPCILFCS